MKKRVVSILVCVALGATLLAGCGSNSTESTEKQEEKEEEKEEKDEEKAEEDAEKAEEDEEEGKDKAAEREEEKEEKEEEKAEKEEEKLEETEEKDTASTGVDYDEINITAVTSYADNQTYGQAMQYFCEYLEENSDGKITCNVYTNGSFCTGPEELEYVSNGSIDVSLTGAAYAVEYLPMAAFSMIVNGGYEAVYEAGRELYFNNEETSKMLNDEAARYNLVPLSCMTAFDIGIWSKNPGGSWEALGENNIVGSAAYVSTFQALGINAQTIQMSDIYESISRGIVTAASVGLYNGYTMGMDELCDYVTVGHGSAVACSFYFNLDTFNSLNADTQALLYEAADAASQFQRDGFIDGDAEVTDIVEAEGIEVQELSDEDSEAYVKQAYIGNYASYYPYAEANGTADEFNALCEFDMEYTGLDMTLEELASGL